MDAIHNPQNTDRFFYIEGSAGTGKSHILTTIVATIQSQLTALYDTTSIEPAHSCSLGRRILLIDNVHLHQLQQFLHNGIVDELSVVLVFASNIHISSTFLSTYFKVFTLTQTLNK